MTRTQQRRSARQPRQWSFGEDTPNTPFSGLVDQYHEAYWAKAGRGL